LVSWNPHEAAARVKSGDCMSIVAGKHEDHAVAIADHARAAS